jgi:hypothetical protein
MRYTFFDKKSGAEIDQRSAFDERGCLKDGISMRTPFQLMDGMPPPPTDEQKEAVRETHKATLSNAWRTPTAPHHRDSAPDAAVLAKIPDIYERRDRELESAWKY